MIFYHTSPVVWVISKELSVLQEDVIGIYFFGIYNSVDQNHSATYKIEHEPVIRLAYIFSDKTGNVDYKY